MAYTDGEFCCQCERVFDRLVLIVRVCVCSVRWIYSQRRSVQCGAHDASRHAAHRRPKQLWRTDCQRLHGLRTSKLLDNACLTTPFTVHTMLDRRQEAKTARTTTTAANGARSARRRASRTGRSVVAHSARRRSVKQPVRRRRRRARRLAAATHRCI